MYLRSLQSSLYASFLTGLFFAVSGVAAAQMMQSSNYQIQSDSINVGGGLSASDNFSLESTLGEVATGDGDSATYALRAGYQQMQEVFLALTGAATVDLSPSIGGIIGGESNGSVTLTVITDSPSGYALSIAAEEAPAMRNGSTTLADYMTTGSEADFSFVTTANDAHFGYSPEGNDVAVRFRNNGVNCGAGTNDTPLTCWDGLALSPTTIGVGVGANHPHGATTTVRFRVGVGSSAVPAAGQYVATTTVTAIPL